MEIVLSCLLSLHHGADAASAVVAVLFPHPALSEDIQILPQRVLGRQLSAKAALLSSLLGLLPRPGSAGVTGDGSQLLQPRDYSSVGPGD